MDTVEASMLEDGTELASAERPEEGQPKMNETPVRVLGDLAALEHELRELIISVLRLSHLEPAAIDRDAPLLRDGLGLDSIDALQLGVAIERTYAVNLGLNDRTGNEVFSSLASLARHLQDARANAK